MQAHDLNLSNADLVVGGVPSYYAQLEPNKIALYDDKKSITYGELNNQVDSIASALITLGVRSGDIVCAYLPNCIEYLLVVLSVARAGAIFSPINPRYKSVEISEILQQSKPNIIFTNVEQAKNIKDELAKKDNQTLVAAVTDTTALFGTCGFVLLLGFVMFMMLSFF